MSGVLQGNKFYFIQVKYMGEVFNRIRVQMVDTRGNRPAGMVRYYKPRGVRTGLRWFHKIRNLYETDPYSIGR